jgi:flagellar basal body-associated protein FliL
VDTGRPAAGIHQAVAVAETAVILMIVMVVMIVVMAMIVVMIMVMQALSMIVVMMLDDRVALSRWHSAAADSAHQSPPFVPGRALWAPRSSSVVICAMVL